MIGKGAVEPVLQLPFQMANFQSPGTFDDTWTNLRHSYTSLPSKLHLHQRDALYWLTEGKNVLLCVGTGIVTKTGTLLVTVHS